MKKNNIKKDFIWNTLGSTIHSFNSLLFLIIVTRINGLEVAGYFSYGFIISNIFLTLATFGGRAFQVTDAKNEFSENTYRSFRVFTTITSLIFLVLLFLFFNYSIYKYLIIILLIIVRVFESISDVYFGILQKNDKLYIVGKSLFYKNLITLIVFILIEIVFKNLYASIASWIAINLLFLIFVDIRNVNKIKTVKKFKFEKNYKKIISKTIFFFAFSFISIFVLNIPRYFIDFYLTDKLQGIYGILIMPATMVILLTQFILQPYTTRLAELNKNNKKEFKIQIKKIFFGIIIVSFVSLLLAYLFGIPVLNFIYKLNLNEYKIDLLIVMIGAMFYALNSFLSLLYTIQRKIKYQFILYLISLVVASLISFILIKNFSFIGGIISYTITMALIFVLYIFKVKKNLE